VPPQDSPSPTPPDWAALAHRHATTRRRRRLGSILGALVATLTATGALIATATPSHHGGAMSKLPTGSPHVSVSSPKIENSPPNPAPAAPPLNPLLFLSDAAHDTAPLTVNGLFQAVELSVGGHSYRRTATASTTHCAAAADASLGYLLGKCSRVLRATYRSGSDEVTVGVLVMPTTADASALKANAAGMVLPLIPNGAKPFCISTVCRETINSVGRYTYMTLGGHADDSPANASDETLQQACDDVGAYVFDSLVERGRAEAVEAASV